MNDEHHNYHRWMKSDKRQNAPKPRPDDRLKSRDPRRSGEIKFLTMVVNDVCGPEKIDLMPRPVVPIPYKSVANISASQTKKLLWIVNNR